MAGGSMTQLSMPGVRHRLPIAGRSERWRRKKEDLHIENHDPNTSHDIAVTIRANGSVVHRGDYHLLPDQSGCSVNLVPVGRYTVTATLENKEQATAELRVSDHINETICIDVTENSVSISQGLQG
jgi:hypothetical protein